MYHAILGGDVETFKDMLDGQLSDSISYMDSAENFYYGFLLGLLKGMHRYTKFSNRENGSGRYDIALKPRNWTDAAILLELKYTKVPKKMEGMCQEALDQIEKNHYADDLLGEGYPAVKKYGICFCKKDLSYQNGRYVGWGRHQGVV